MVVCVARAARNGRGDLNFYDATRRDALLFTDDGDGDGERFSNGKFESSRSTKLERGARGARERQPTLPSRAATPLAAVVLASSARPVPHTAYRHAAPDNRMPRRSTSDSSTNFGGRGAHQGRNGRL